MDSLKNILSDIKQFIYGGLQTFPLSIASTMLFIGLFTANYAMLFFLVGFLILIPGFALGMNSLAGLIFSDAGSPFLIKNADVCRVAIPFSTIHSPPTSNETVVVSEWTAMTLFFFGYILMNAYQLIEKPSPVNSDPGKTITRTTQAYLSIASTIIVLIVVMYTRIYSKCEAFSSQNGMWRENGLWLPKLMVILFMFAILGLGAEWYFLLAQVGEDRLSDLFGIANRLLPPKVYGDGPVACVPIPS
jgi:hypothetical protein